MDELNKDQQTQEQVIPNIGLSPEQMAVMKEQADRLLVEKAKIEAQASNEKAFNDVYENSLKNPSVAPLKDFVDAELAKNPELKGAGVAGATIAFRTAKEKWEAAQGVPPTTTQTLSTDSLGKGAVPPVVANVEGIVDEQGIPRQETNPNLIDFSKVDLEKCTPAMARFAIRQKQKVRNRR